MKYFIYLLFTTSILLSNSLEKELLNCSVVEDSKSKLACYDAIASKITLDKGNITIKGTAFVKDSYSGKILAICKGDPVFLVPTEKDSDFTSLDMLIAVAKLSYIRSESKKLGGDFAEANKLLKDFYTKRREIEEKLNSLRRNKNIYQTKCSLNSNFSISNISKGEYSIRAYIKKLDNGSYFSLRETKSIMQNEEITLIGE